MAETSGTPVRWEDFPGQHQACDEEIARLRERVSVLEAAHERDALAVEAHRARADHQQRRAAEAEEELARFAAHVSRYDELAEQAAGGGQAAAAAEEQRHVNEVISAHKDWIEAELDKADAKLAAAVAAERERIRQLAIRNHAVCTGDDGTSCYFAALIGEPSDG